MRQQNPFYVFYKKIMKKKLWKKTNIYLEVGNCRYCNEKIFNNDSFVSFLSKDHAHYLCMKEHDELHQERTINA